MTTHTDATIRGRETVSKSDNYRARLGRLTDWAPFLRKESGLPGPRGNLELAQVVAELASARQIESFLSIPEDQAPENSPAVFVVFCGVVALGRQAATGGRKRLARLRKYAGDSRWRIREAVAIALQSYGDVNIMDLVVEMQRWCNGTWYEKRAAAAALAEPRLLKSPAIAQKVLHILDTITAAVELAGDPGAEDFKTLRKTLGYCWSVAIAASPRLGKPLLEKWLKSRSHDVKWIMKENLKKNRLVRMDRQWVRACLARLSS
jgi:hypothetical protein